MHRSVTASSSLLRPRIRHCHLTHRHSFLHSSSSKQPDTSDTPDAPDHPVHPMHPIHPGHHSPSYHSIQKRLDTHIAQLQRQLAQVRDHFSTRVADIGSKAEKEFGRLGGRINEVTGYKEVESLKVQVVEKGEISFTPLESRRKTRFSIALTFSSSRPTRIPFIPPSISSSSSQRSLRCSRYLPFRFSTSSYISPRT